MSGKISVLIAGLSLFFALSAHGEGVVKSDNNSQSGCKGSGLGYWRPAFTEEDEEEEEPRLLYTVEYKDKTLTVVWHDVVEDCGTVLDYGTLELVDDHHLLFSLVFDDEWPKADCMCIYDFTAVYKDIEPGEYILSFRDYRNGYPITLSDETSVNFYMGQSVPTSVEKLSATETALQFVDYDNVAINCVEAYKVEIFDFNGVKVAQSAGEGNSSISLAGLEHGAYIIKLITKNHEESLKVLR